MAVVPTFVPMTSENIYTNATNDAFKWRETILWLEQTCKRYNRNMGVDNMTAAGLTSDQQTIMLAFIADLNRAYGYVTGTNQGIANNHLDDLTAMLGIL
jgi:hypothetical protein